MVVGSVITNERQEREARTLLAQVEDALSSDAAFQSLIAGLPVEIIDGVRRLLSTERRELRENLEAYTAAIGGDLKLLAKAANGDPGALLIVARVARGWTQKELSRRLFVPEQQVQRYEAERYRSISLAGLLRVCRTLGVQLSANVPDQLDEAWLPDSEMSARDLTKVLRHARENGWLQKVDQSDESGMAYLRRTVAEHVGDHGTPSLFRTGLNVRDHNGDWLLLAWKAQVTKRAKAEFATTKARYRPTNLGWLPKLVRLSAEKEGPLLAQKMLRENGIFLIIEKYMPGLNVDGAAFLVDDLPVIGMTLLRDRLDNFWFTLLHEIGHIVLHYRTGLAAGFFDDIEDQELGDLEDEANQFAGSLLIPDEIWRRTPARIANSPEPIEALAKKLSISPAIIFGRIRKERSNYNLFANRVGQGEVRPFFFQSERKEASNVG
jgi:HTH-type transcriptional regulator / antitoxin HigA